MRWMKSGGGGAVLVARKLHLPPGFETGVLSRLAIGAADGTELVVAHEEVDEESEGRGAGPHGAQSRR